MLVAHDLAAGRVRRVLGVADGAQRRAVQQRAVIQMQDEDRRIGRDGVDFVEGRQPLLGKLVFGEAADHAHPLRRGRAVDLLLQHAHRVGQRADAVPAQLHVVVQPTADDVHVAVDEAGNDTAALEIDHFRVRAGERHDAPVVEAAMKRPSLMAMAWRSDLRAVERRDFAVEEHVSAWQSVMMSAAFAGAAI